MPPNGDVNFVVLRTRGRTFPRSQLQAFALKTEGRGLCRPPPAACPFDVIKVRRLLWALRAHRVVTALQCITIDRRQLRLRLHHRLPPQPCARNKIAAQALQFLGLCSLCSADLNAISNSKQRVAYWRARQSQSKATAGRPGSPDRWLPSPQQRDRRSRSI